MTSPRAARLAAAAAVVLAVVVVFPGRHAALAAPNDYASDSSSVSDGDGSPLPVANTGLFDPWDHAANHRGPLPYKPYAGVPVTDTDRYGKPLPKADFMKDRMQEAIDFTNFITARAKAETDLAMASMKDAAMSIRGHIGSQTSREQKKLLKNLLSKLINVVKDIDIHYGSVNWHLGSDAENGRHPSDYDKGTVANWIMDFATDRCDNTKRKIASLQNVFSTSYGVSSSLFGNYAYHRRYLEVLKKTVDAVEFMAIEFVCQLGGKKHFVQYAKYYKHFGELDTFLRKADSLDTLMETPYMDVDGSLSSSEMWSAGENLLAIERDNNISKP